MTTPHLIGLLASHAGLALLGFSLAGKTHVAKPDGDRNGNAALPEKSVRREAKPTSPNPILRASAADFRAAWHEMIRGQQPSINFFLDWCAVDPDDAIRGLTKLYAPEEGESYLRNAVGSYGAELAPALAKQWREFRYLDNCDVEGPLGRSLNALAKKDPETAVALTMQLPPGLRPSIYRNLFDHLDMDALRKAVEELSASRPVEKEEATALWNAVAYAVDGADPKQGIWNWLARADDIEALRALAQQGMIKSGLAENWGPFVEAVIRLDAPVQAEVREQLREHLASQKGNSKSTTAIAEECKRRGIEDWTAGIAH
jgi:hypothetical protein